MLQYFCAGVFPSSAPLLPLASFPQKDEELNHLKLEVLRLTAENSMLRDAANNDIVAATATTNVQVGWCKPTGK
jgi:hypothetical protein